MADSRIALAKLTSGQTLTDEDKRILGLPVTDSKPPTSGPVPLYIPKPPATIPTTGDIQGPMIGNNLGKDAAAVIAAGKGDTLSPEAKAAGEAYNVAKGLKPDGSPKDKEIDPYAKDAYAILEDAFRTYGLESLVPVIQGYMKNNLGVEQAKLKLKTEQAYKDRFKGNELRISKGLNALSEDAYLALENDYSETLRAYGLSSYFGVAVDSASRLERQKKMAEVIGNDISATEFKTRVGTAVTRVQNSDKNTRDAFKALYGIGDTDLVKFFLDPTKGSAELQMKAQAAEISGAAVTAGLAGTSLASAEELAKLGVDKTSALQGYSRIAEYLPVTDLLSQIYDETGITYNRSEAESEVFKGTASAKRKRTQLAELETSNFAGSSGNLQSNKPRSTAGIL